jgi:hypothetical protein
MVQHEKARPRHHFGTMAAAVLLLLSYSTALTAPALADGPSAATQKFFGFSSDDGQGSSFSQPASCDISKLQAENKSLNEQMAQIDNESQSKLKTIQDEQSKLKPGDTAGGQKLQDEQTQVLNDTKSQLAAIKAKQDVIHSQTQGPSKQCKEDTVKEAVAKAQSLHALFAGSQMTGTLDKVDSVVNEIQGLEPKLQADGVSSKDMNTIKTEIAGIKKDNTTLRSFFSGMASQTSSFISDAQADPIGTYDKMQNGSGPLSSASGSGASAAANGLVSSFTSLVNLFDQLTGQGGQ